MQSTTDLSAALRLGYIGEVPIFPKAISSAVHAAVTGRPLPSVLVFYCGTRDAELDELFGYAEIVK